jgi:predicted small metal-binding protein
MKDANRTGPGHQVVMDLSCDDIGIANCDFAVQGGGRVLDEMVEHLRKRHGYQLTVADVTTGEFEAMQQPERMIAARLHRRVSVAE